MNAKQEKDIIRTLVKAGNEPLAKRFARSRGYRVRGSAFDPRKAVVYFELFDHDEYGGDEMATLKELKKLLKVRKIDNEGHDNDFNLICRISVNSLREVEKLFDLVLRNASGGWDTIYVDDMEAKNFVLYPEGVNGPQIPTEDINGFLEDVT